MRLDTRKDIRAIQLLIKHEPEEGYYLAFSGGKDSCVIKKLAQLAGVKFDAWYNNTTIDPPELVHFIKRYHSDVKWSNSRYGNMMHYVSIAPTPPPTRTMRWCCSKYKEYGGRHRVKIMGVRAAESPRRKKSWFEVSEDKRGDIVICPIIDWDDEYVWNFINRWDLPYCSLYDEGWSRLGCVGCPLASDKIRDIEFERWPNYERNWRNAIIANWEKWHNIPNTRTGEPRLHAKFSNGEEMYWWWRRVKHSPDYIRGECQSELLWTNEPGATSDEIEEFAG